MEENWVKLLTNWPQDVRRRGIAVTSFGESIEFCSYMLMGTVLLLERERPDAQGGRRVMLQLAQLALIKIVDPVDMEQFGGFGFVVPTQSS